jgi:hypothetical protein
MTSTKKSSNKPIIDLIRLSKVKNGIYSCFNFATLHLVHSYVIILIHSNVSKQAMIASCYSLPVLYILLFSLSSLSFASERSSDNNNDDETKFESNTEEKWQTNDEEYIDESNYNSASYQHEQALIANIYAPNRTYISVHDDRIHPSNFSYFTFNNLGSYRFILIPLRGDSDLYISTRDKQVSYQNYEFSSCTCGIDEILIDSYVKRPIYIGVYGYSQYQISYYRLLVELVDSTTPIDETFVVDQSTADNSRQKQSPSNQNKKPSKVVVEGEKDRQHLLWNIFVWLLNFLVEVLT